MKREKRIIIGGLLCLLVCLTAGCKRAENQDAGQFGDKVEEKITLTFLVNVDSRGAEGERYQELVYEFNKSHKNIYVRLEGISTEDDYDAILTKRLEEGQGDDIYMVGTDQVREFYRKGYFYDLSGLPSYLNLNASAKEQCTVNDIAYGIPTDMTAYGMLVNVGLLRDNGLEPPQNYDEWITCCKVLKKNGITPISLNRWYALTVPVMARGFYPIYSSGYQDEIIDGLNRGDILIGDYMLEGFKMFEIFVQEGYYGDEITEHSMNQESFINGETAFLFAAVRDGLITDLADVAPDMELVIQGIPAMPNGTVCLTMVTTRVSINPASQHRNEAVEFVDFLTSPEGQAFLDTSPQILPLREADTYSGEDERVTAIVNLLKEDGQIPIGDSNLKLDYLDTVGELCFQIVGGMTAREAAEAFNQIQMEQIERFDKDMN